MIFVVQQIQEKCREQNQELFMAFIDLTKAFDSISREALWKVLSRFGCPVNLIKILRLIHDKMTATVLFNGTDTEPFTIQTWVKQGCVIAPTLFTVYLCATLFLLRDRLPHGVELEWRLDAKLFNHSRLKANTKMMKTSSSLPTLQKNFRLV